LVRTSDGEVPAKELIKGQKLVAPLLAEQSADDPGDDQPAMFEWRSDTLTFQGLVETELSIIVEKISNVLYFNNNPEAKFSETQTLYIKRDNEYRIVPTGTVVEGDILIKVTSEGAYEEEVVTSITLEDDPQMTYLVACEPQDWFIAGGYLVHNK
jgi:hypothetical protein